MSTFSSKTKKSLLFITGLVPLLVMIATLVMWVDLRYMHREISDVRYIDLQIRILELQISELEEIKDQASLTAQEQRQYDLHLLQLRELIKERNKQLGIG